MSNNSKYSEGDDLWNLVAPPLDKHIPPVHVPFEPGPEEESTTKKSMKQRTEPAKSFTPSRTSTNVLYSLACISIGNMIVKAGCRVQIVTFESTTRWLLLSHDGMEGTVEFKINLNDGSVQEMKYFSDTASAKEAKKTVVLDDDTHDRMSFVAMKVIPNEVNGLDKLSTFENPEAEESDQEASLKKYVVMEFRSDEYIHASLKTLREHETLSAYFAPESVLSDKTKAEYGGVMLLKAANDDY